MFLPSAERYSTVACDPTLSLPSTLVSPSIRNSMVFLPCPLVTSSEKAASPIDAIFPDWDGLSAAGADLVRTRRSGTGVAQAAAVKHTTNSEARLSAVRNRIGIPPFCSIYDQDRREGHE